MSRHTDTSRPAPGADNDLDNEALESLGRQREYDEEMERGREECRYRRYFCDSCGNHHTGIINSGRRYCPGGEFSELPEPSTNKAQQTR